MSNLMDPFIYSNFIILKKSVHKRAHIIWYASSICIVELHCYFNSILCYLHKTCSLSQRNYTSPAAPKVWTIGNATHNWERKVAHSPLKGVGVPTAPQLLQHHRGPGASGATWVYRRVWDGRLQPPAAGLPDALESPTLCTETGRGVAGLPDPSAHQHDLQDALKPLGAQALQAVCCQRDSPKPQSG